MKISDILVRDAVILDLTSRAKRDVLAEMAKALAAAVPALRQRRPRFEDQRIRMYCGVRLRTPDDPPADDDEDE